MNPARRCLLALVVAPAAFAQPDMSSVVIEAKRVSDNVYMVTGRGGNIGLSIGADGAFLVDDQYGKLTERILKTVAELTPEPVKFVVNTH